jgi:hypothetical protein
MRYSKRSVAHLAAFSPKMARSMALLGVSSVSPFGVPCPTRMSPVNLGHRCG